ncbi:MAG: M48 family metallopeptidase [gamma proteobacterium symbiont of Taylorina sp.]|nr:M48 family metallopeptidase [gamma proteobacterium symbiont of Taylorina sp.]
MPEIRQHEIIEKYSIRISKRAKYMRISVSLEKGIVVVVPKTMSRFHAKKLIPEFVRKQQEWILRSINKLQLQNEKKLLSEPCQLPDKIILTALQQTFIIHYISQDNKALVVQQHDDMQLTITGNVEDKMSIFKLLELFFKNYARQYLKQRLDQLSREYELPYRRLTIRAQKTRWGSCSSKKNINLNYRLIFMDNKLLDYILVHELLHTIYMNHSKAYWAQLELLMPDALYRDKRLNLAAKELPCWMFHK